MFEVSWAGYPQCSRDQRRQTLLVIPCVQGVGLFSKGFFTLSAPCLAWGPAGWSSVLALLLPRKSAHCHSPSDVRCYIYLMFIIMVLGRGGKGNLCCSG